MIKSYFSRASAQQQRSPSKLHKMLRQGIIEESSSPWMAPAVFVPKKTGEIRICIDYRELSKKTTTDAYPLPPPDEVQDRICKSTVFSTVDFHAGYWQLPVNPADREKTAFCPGPGMGLFQFSRIPFGLSGASSSFQRLMDKVFRNLPFVTTYMDDILVHSKTEGQETACGLIIVKCGNPPPLPEFLRSLLRPGILLQEIYCRFADIATPTYAERCLDGRLCNGFSYAKGEVGTGPHSCFSTI